MQEKYNKFPLHTLICSRMASAIHTSIFGMLGHIPKQILFTCTAWQYQNLNPMGSHFNQ